MTIPIYNLFWTGSILSPGLVEYSIRKIDNYMSNWKVIALASGNIEAVSGKAALDHSYAHELIGYEGHSCSRVC